MILKKWYGREMDRGKYYCTLERKILNQNVAFDGSCSANRL